MDNSTFFIKAIRRFSHIRRGSRPLKLTPVKKMIRLMRHSQICKRYVQKHGIVSKRMPALWHDFDKSKRHWRYVFNKHDTEVLCMAGVDLEVLARQYGVDPNLPTQEKQEAAYQAFADDMIHGDPKWTKEKVAREKKAFLATLEKAPMFNLACQISGLKESLVRTWMRADLDFADEIRLAQTRMGERIMGSLIAKAIGEGDVGAQMYLIKQYGSAIKLIDQEAVDLSERTATTQGMDISKLPLEEQETLLRLMRKAQEGESSTKLPVTEFPQVEYDNEEQREFVEEQVHALIEQDQTPPDEVIDVE